MTYNVETAFAALDYLVIYNTSTPLGKTVLGAFHDFTDAASFLIYPFAVLNFPNEE